jgi:hypothetical protein
MVSSRRGPRVARICGALAVTSLMTLAGGCAAGGAAGTPARHGSPISSAAAAGTPTKLEAVAGQYIAIAVPANRRLDHAVTGFAAHQRGDLAAAAADLHAQAVTERWFDRRLAAIPFPPAIAAIARATAQVNDSRAALADREARAASLTELRSFAGQHQAADAAVEFGVRLIREALGLPPPSAS